MATWTIASSFEIQVGTVTGVDITVDYLAGKDFINDGSVNAYLNSMRLNQTPTGLPGEIGEMSWNSDFNVPEVKLNANVTAQIPLEQYVPVVNKTDVEITDGQAVYISGAQGNRPTSSLAKANALNTSIIIGVATQNIADNAEGFVTTFGVVHGFDTSGFTEGDLLYISAGTAGVVTNVIPSSPNFNVSIGTALNSTLNGSIHVIPRAPISLDGTLSGNSDLVSPSEKAVKTYVDASGGGGAEIFEYTNTFFIDSPSTTNWILKAPTGGENAHEMSQNTGVTFSSAFPSGATSLSYREFVAPYNMTINNISFRPGYTGDEFVKAVRIFKVGATTDAKSLIYENSSLVLGNFDILDLTSADFIALTLDKGDFVIFSVGVTSINDIYSCNWYFKGTKL